MSAANTPTPAPAGRPALIGGYRVIRALGTGTRATVWVGHSSQRADLPTVALKVFVDADDDSIAAETAAYESVDSQHVVRLLDVCNLPDSADGSGVVSATGSGVCMVLEWLGEGSLATLVRQRRRIRAGEAVTVLVSVLRAIRDLHAAGLAHNAVLPTNVLFDRSGRPVLISLGHTTRLPPMYSDAAIDARNRDWAQLLTVLDLVMGRVEVDGREVEVAGIRRALEELALGRDERELCDRAEDTLFALAQPAPLVLHPTSIPGAVHRSESDESEPASALRQNNRRAVGTVGADAVGAGFAARTDAILNAGPLRSLKAAAAPVLRKRRKQLVFGAVLASVVGVVGLAAIPPAEEGSASTAGSSLKRGEPTHTSRAETSRPSPTVSANAPDVGTADPISHDEPVAAVAALLTVRAHCFEKQSAACLNLVDQDASPLLEADTAALKAPDTLLDVSGADASLIERTGDSALVELVQPDQSGQPQGGTSKPVSVLAIRGESGWRLREIFAA